MTRIERESKVFSATLDTLRTQLQVVGASFMESEGMIIDIGVSEFQAVGSLILDIGDQIDQWNTHDFFGEGNYDLVGELDSKVTKNDEIENPSLSNLNNDNELHAMKGRVWMARMAIFALLQDKWRDDQAEATMEGVLDQLTDVYDDLENIVET
ncbi:MAG: hypothetical protein JRC68_07755 [Deltaproteobacteria bacterium]|nr:hypothetical protein [Deltaproteobacteria bacterium]